MDELSLYVQRGLSRVAAESRPDRDLYCAPDNTETSYEIVEGPYGDILTDSFLLHSDVMFRVRLPYSRSGLVTTEVSIRLTALRITKERDAIELEGVVTYPVECGSMKPTAIVPINGTYNIKLRLGQFWF